MLKMTVIHKAGDQTERVMLSVDRTTTGEDIIGSAVANWSLPTDTDYSLINTATGNVILPFLALSPDLVADGQVLEVEQVQIALG